MIRQSDLMDYTAHRSRSGAIAAVTRTRASICRARGRNGGPTAVLQTLFAQRVPAILHRTFPAAVRTARRASESCRRPCGARSDDTWSTCTGNADRATGSGNGCPGGAIPFARDCIAARYSGFSNRRFLRLVVRRQRTVFKAVGANIQPLPSAFMMKGSMPRNAFDAAARRRAGTVGREDESRMKSGASCPSHFLCVDPTRRTSCARTRACLRDRRRRGCTASGECAATTSPTRERPSVCSSCGLRRARSDSCRPRSSRSRSSIRRPSSRHPSGR